MAAITRTSICTGRVPPTRSNSRSCSTRSSLACKGRSQLADFIQKYGAAVGHFQFAFFLRHGAREGALLVAEQLAFEQGFGKGGAVDGDEGLAARGLLR